MFSEVKVAAIYCIADDFCKEFAKVQEKYMVEGKNHKHRNKPNRMSDAEIMVILILFHSGGFRCFKHYYKEYICKHLTHLFPRRVSYNRFVELITKVKNNMKNSLMSVANKILLRKRALIETVNDELKNIAQIEHSRHRSFNNFIANSLSAIAAYCFFEKSPPLTCVSSKTGNLLCFELYRIPFAIISTLLTFGYQADGILFR